MDINFELLYTLEESLTLVGDLLQQAERGKDDIRRCLGGEPLAEYLKSADKAEQVLRELKQSLLSLQTELAVGL